MNTITSWRNQTQNASVGQGLFLDAYKITMGLIMVMVVAITWQW